MVITSEIPNLAAIPELTSVSYQANLGAHQPSLHLRQPRALTAHLSAIQAIAAYFELEGKGRMDSKPCGRDQHCSSRPTG